MSPEIFLGEAALVAASLPKIFLAVGETLPSKARKIFFDLGLGPQMAGFTLSLGPFLGAIEGLF